MAANIWEATVLEEGGTAVIAVGRFVIVMVEAGEVDGWEMLVVMAELDGVVANWVVEVARVVLGTAWVRVVVVGPDD